MAGCDLRGVGGWGRFSYRCGLTRWWWDGWTGPILVRHPARRWDDLILRSTSQHPVALVFDGEFGARLVDLAARIHVWALESPVNRAAAERIRSDAPVSSLDRGITLFRGAATDSPAAMLADQIGIIAEHHGPFAHDPPMDAVEVYGVAPDAEVLAVLTSCGWGALSVTEAGFVARQSRVV